MGPFGLKRCDQRLDSRRADHGQRIGRDTGDESTLVGQPRRQGWRSRAGSDLAQGQSRASAHVAIRVGQGLDQRCCGCFFTRLGQRPCGPPTGIDPSGDSAWASMAASGSIAAALSWPSSRAAASRALSSPQASILSSSSPSPSGGSGPRVLPLPRWSSAFR